MKKLWIILAAAGLMSCENESSSDGSRWTTDDYAPRDGDAALTRGAVMIDAARILVLEKNSPDFRLELRGSLPTPCHQLRAIVRENSAERTVSVETYSLVDPNVVCIQVLEAFSTVIHLPTPPQGRTDRVLLNGRAIGQIGY